MRKLKWEIVERTLVKNNIGEASYIYSPIGEFHSSTLIPLGISSPIKEWGFDPLRTFNVHTRDDIPDNSFVRLGDDVYHIKTKQPYIKKHSILFLELIKK